MAHYCGKHGVPFTQTAKQKAAGRGYSHPIKDDEDNVTGWCNEEEKPKVESKAPDMSKDDWAEKDRITRASIEKQVALKCACDSSEGEPTSKIIERADWFYNWLQGERTTTKPEIPAEGKTIPKTFKDLGAFLTAAKDVYGLVGVALLDALHIKSTKEITNFDVAWKSLEGLKVKELLEENSTS